ncbi:hypothetical protein [Modestobacter sp. Leaf380]|uniref:hypothetical protein n=1 Tax=Modestobacter sp. Leaf380 TaxID=1736356 RepID=UPI0012FABC69|nr:hypothetical protein [Modestobacter sp. Leaf380]
MRSRLMWALLLLAAVFSMHGLSCAAADQGPEQPAESSTAAAALAPTAQTGMSHMVAGGAGLTATPGQTAPDPAAAGVGDSTEHPAGHSGAVHALMVCLAVLSGGVGIALAVLAAWLARRRLLTVMAPASDRLRTAVGSVVASLPAPELSRLCVLRV